MVGACALVMCAGGCYHRVVSSKGVGGRTAAVEEPYRSNTAADRWIDETFGDPPPKKKSVKWVEK